MNTNDFYEWMQNIYEKFENNSPNNKWIVPNFPENPNKLYLTVLRYPEEIEEEINKVSNQINRIVPSVVYWNNQAPIHTTLLDTVPNSPHLNEFEEILNKIDMWHYHIKNNLCIYLSNENSAIIKCFPNEDFVLLSDEIYQKVNWILQPKKPWWSHITISRYKENTDKEVWSELMNYLNSLKTIWKVNPERIEVWEALLWDKTFEVLKVKESVKLK